MDQAQLYISPHELEGYLNGEEPPFLIDVRPHEEYDKGHLPGAVNIPRDELSGRVDEIPTDRYMVVTYCNMRHPGQSSSEAAAQTLRQMGFDARALQGGFPEWEAEDLPTERKTQAGR